VAAALDRLTIEAALGIAHALERHGPARLRQCAASPCEEAFIDTSRNGSRRYCCERCANRHNVAAFRRRQRPRDAAR
jgi:predicted RNA-binding Zn ribbon-like protein